VGYRRPRTLPNYHIQLLPRSSWHHCRVWCHWYGTPTSVIVLL